MRTIALTGLIAAGCGPAPSGEVLSGGDDPVTSGTATTTGSVTTAADTGGTALPSSSAPSSTGWSSSTASAGTWPAEDVGAPTTGDSGRACRGKVDVIFVITEGSNEPQLEEALPAFAAIMQEEFSDLDLHVMVLDPDGEWGESLFCPKNKCPADGGCMVEPDFPCWALHEEGALTKCDNTRGAGVIFPAGKKTMNNLRRSRSRRSGPRSSWTRTWSSPRTPR